jgi:putative ABC transport system permease protein
MKFLRFALRLLSRDVRGGEIGVLFAAILVATAGLSSVGFLTSRMSQLIREQAAVVLAADLRLESGRPLGADGRYFVEARARDLKTATTISFASVVFEGSESQLATVVAVDGFYPLRGQLRVSEVPFGPARPIDRGPSAGEAWADPRLLARLGIPVGGELRLGASTFRVAEVLDYRPDQGAGFADLAPTVLINVQDLPATRLLTPASRATWSALFAGPQTSIKAYAAWLKSRKSDAERLIDVAESSTQLQSAIERAGRFLNLAALVTLVLAAVAVAMAARRFVTRHLDLIALMKCLGARQRFVLTVTLLELLLVGAIAAGIGLLVGYGAQLGLGWLLRDLLKGPLPAPTWMPVWLSLGTAFTILVGFALPPLLELRRVPPARVLRRHLEPPQLRYGLPYLMAGAALLATLYGLVRDPRLVTYAGAAAVSSAIALYAAGRGLVKLTQLLRGRAGAAWRYGLSSLARRGHESAVQVVAFGLGLTVLLLLAVVRNDLLTEWRQSLPENAPNHFLINIAPTDVTELRAFFSAQGLGAPDLAPWVRGRLIAVNDVAMRDRMPVSDRGRGFAEREQNLSWSSALPADNQIVAGRWWPERGPSSPEVSVATEFQESLGLRVGDRLTFDIAGETVVATVGSVRKVRWDGFRPNFFLVFSPGVLDKATGTFMTSVHLDAAQRPLLAQIVKRFPNITIFDVDQLLVQVRTVMDRAAVAVQDVFGFTLLAGLVVLMAAIQSTRDERRYESAILRTLGARRRVVLAAVAVEFATLGLLAGLLASAAAEVTGWWLATRLFNLHYAADFRIWVLGTVSGALLVGVAGTLATRSVVNAPPILTLRDG